MKKIIIFFLMILSVTIFSEEYKPYLKKNATNKNLDNFSIYDEIFTSTSNKDILNKIPEDSDESYVSY